MRKTDHRAAVHSNGKPENPSLARKLASHSGSSSGTSSPTTRSQAKQKNRITSPERPLLDPDKEVSGPSDKDSATVQPLQDPIVSFPTAGRPVSDTVLKEKLLSLKASLKTDMTAEIRNCQREVQAVGGRVDHIEHKMDDYSVSFNTL